MIKKNVNLKKILSVIVIFALTLLLIFFIVSRNKQNQSILNSKADTTLNSKVAITDFYWWYPWYGMFYNQGNGFVATSNVGGFASQQAFAYTFDHPIPYLQSEERPNGAVSDRAGIDWFKGNFERAASAGIKVITPMSRPDLKKWKYALGLMLTALKELNSEGKSYPKLMFHWDGVEYWVNQTHGDLTGPGLSFDTIWNGVKDSYDTVFNNLSPSEINKYLFTYPDGNTFPSITYRIEDSSPGFKTSNWWVTQLKLNFAATYAGKQMYLVLDSFWCNKDYGYNNVIHTASCNADNYYKWGGALNGAGFPGHGKDPGIITVGPGFARFQYDGVTIVANRNNGDWLTSQFNKATTLGNWIILETFNFGEEGSAIDSTTSFGNQYLNLTKQLINNWDPPVACTSYTYSSWGACVNSTQTRTITSSMPQGCIVGNTEPLTQPCTMPNVNIKANVICQDGNGPIYNISGADISLQSGGITTKITDSQGNVSFQTPQGSISLRLIGLESGSISQTNQPYSSLVLTNSAMNCRDGTITKCTGGIPTTPGNFCSNNNASYEYCNLTGVSDPGLFSFKLSNCGTPTSSSSSISLVSNSSSTSVVISSSAITSSSTSVTTSSSAYTSSSVSSSNKVCGQLDIDNDNKVTIIDFIHLSKLYGSSCSDNTFVNTSSCGMLDSNKDGIINIIDFINFAGKFGRSC